MNLVTGSTGIVGIHVMLALLRRGEEVKALCRKTSDRQTVAGVFAHYGAADLYPKIVWAEGDLLDRQSLVEALQDVDTVYHAAAMVSFCKKDRKAMWAANVEGTANMVDAAIASGVGAFCHVSSIGALGKAMGGGIVTEDTPWQVDDRRSVYSQSKFRQEMEVWRGAENGLNVVVVNPGVVLGPGRKGRSSALIAQTMKRGTSFYTDGATGYVDARDVAQAMVELTAQKLYGQRFVVVGHNSETRTVQTLFAEAFGKKPPYRKASRNMLYLAAFAAKTAAFFTGSRPALTYESVRAIGGHQKYSSDKLTNAIGLKFTSLEDSVRNMASFYMK